MSKLVTQLHQLVGYTGRTTAVRLGDDEIVLLAASDEALKRAYEKLRPGFAPNCNRFSDCIIISAQLFANPVMAPRQTVARRPRW